MPWPTVLAGSLQYCPEDRRTSTDGDTRVSRADGNTWASSPPNLDGVKGAVAWERFLNISGPVTFVQVGAHEGNVGDAMWPYATHYKHWRGLLVEPTAVSFTKLCNNYRPHARRIRCVKAAVSDFAGVAKMQIMRNGCPSGQCNHLLHPRDNVKWHNSWARTKEMEKVPVITLASVWEELRAAFGASAAVDLLVVDVEGIEERLLGSELPSPRPHLVMFEHKHLHQQAKQHINASLTAQGYEFVGGVAGGSGGVVDVKRGHGDWLYAQTNVAKSHMAAQPQGSTRDTKGFEL